MKKFILLMANIFFLLTMGMLACDSEDDEYNRIQYNHRTSKRLVQLLAIGNSYSQDALAYVPFIMQNMGVDVDILIGILMQSSSSLKMHVDNFEKDTAAYTFFLYDGGSSWKNYGHKTIQWALDNCNWDIVTLQQGSNIAVYDWGRYQPWCDKLINYVRGHVDYPVKFVWYQPMARPAKSNANISTGDNWSDAVITEHYENTARSSKRILEETICEYVVPVGTAIQNARSIERIKVLGDYANNPHNTSKMGYLTCNDGVHLQEGLPCQIAAYTFVQVLLDVYGLEQYSIIGETTRVTAEWAAGKSIPGPHGEYIGSTDENCRIAQECAIMAIEHPYEVTDMNYLIKTK